MSWRKPRDEVEMTEKNGNAKQTKGTDSKSGFEKKTQIKNHETATA
jgi:hypothetical protein